MKVMLIIMVIISLYGSDALRWTTFQPNSTFNWTEITNSFSYMRRPITPFISQILPQGANLFACEPIKLNVIGKVVMVAFGNCSIERHILFAKRAGARGMLLVGDGWRGCNLIDQHQNAKNDTLPTICVNSNDVHFKKFAQQLGKNIAQKKGTLVEFTPGRNPFDSLNKGAMVFKRILMLVLTSLLILVSIYKLYGFFRYDRKNVYVICALFICFFYPILLLMYDIDTYGYSRLITNWQYQIVLNNLKYIIFVPLLSIISILHMKILFKVHGAIFNKAFLNLLFLFSVMVEVPLFMVMITFATYTRSAKLYETLMICVNLFFGINTLIYWMGGILLLYKLLSTKGMKSTLENIKTRQYVKFTAMVLLFGFFTFCVFVSIIPLVDPISLSDMFRFVIPSFLLDIFILFACYVAVFMFSPKTSPNMNSSSSAKTTFGSNGSNTSFKQFKDELIEPYKEK